jgi:SAM-dependent methyltransferase
VPFAEYKRLLAQAYDLDKPDAPADELERWRGHVSGAPGPVLEVMCGTGRFLVPLAVDGVDIDGVDASPDMLAACSAKCDALGVSVALRQQFVQDLDMPREYALAFIAAGSFGLLVEEADYRVGLRRVFEHLLPGGTLVLEAETTLAAPKRSGRWFGRWWDRPDGARIVSRDLGRYDDTTHVEEGLGIYELYVDARLVETEMNNWVRRFWNERELANEIERSGFATPEITTLDNGMLLAVTRREGAVVVD